MAGIIDQALPDETLAILAAAHGDAPVATIHWTPKGVEATLGDSQLTRQAVDAIIGIGNRFGLPIASAALFSSCSRMTLTMRMGIAGSTSELTLHYDSRDGRMRMEILHPDRRKVAFASSIDKMSATGDPFEIIALHHGEDDGKAVAGELKRIGLKPAIGDIGTTPVEMESYEIVEDRQN